MSDPLPTVVHARSDVVDIGSLIRVEPTSIDDALGRLDRAETPADLLLAVDRASNGDSDAFVALVSVLVAAGVEHIETTSVRAVERVFATHLAISTGHIEVLES